MHCRLKKKQNDMLTRNPKALAIRLLTLAALVATLSSFSRFLGADSFKVYLNDNLIFEQYVTPETSVQAISLSESSGDEMLTVYYDHCGHIGKQRSLTLLDGNSVLKKWDFPNAKTVASSGMRCPIREIKAMQTPGKTISLVYESLELQSPLTLLTFSSSGLVVKADNR